MAILNMHSRVGIMNVLERSFRSYIGTSKLSIYLPVVIVECFSPKFYGTYLLSYTYTYLPTY